MRNKRKYIRTTGIILLFCVALLNTACVSKQKEKVVLELKQGLLSIKSECCPGTVFPTGFGAYGRAYLYRKTSCS